MDAPRGICAVFLEQHNKYFNVYINEAVEFHDDLMNIMCVSYVSLGSRKNVELPKVK